MFSFCSILVPIVTDLKVIQFVCVLAPAGQIIIFRYEEADFISTVLLSNDSPCTWLEHKECTSVYASATNLVWGLECLSFKFMCDQTSLYWGMGLFRSDLCCTSMASVFFNANISRQVLLPWQFHTAGKFAEMSSTREHRKPMHPQQATHIVLLWLGLEAVIGFFDDIHINGVMPEALISLHSQILPLLQHEIMFLDELECNIDIYWRVCLHMLILFVQCSLAEQQFLCGDVVGRLMLDRGVLIAFLFDEKGKTKYLWRPWVYEFFMVLLQTFSVEWQFILFYWRVGDVAQELDCYSNVACESNNVLCILVSNIVPKPVWKCMSLSTAGKKVVMVFFYKILICGFSLAAPFTSQYQALNLLYCTTLLVLKQECEVAIGWELLRRYIVSHTGTTPCGWSIAQEILKETKLLLFSVEPQFSDFTWENQIVLSPKSGQRHQLKAHVPQNTVTFASSKLGCELLLTYTTWLYGIMSALLDVTYVEIFSQLYDYENMCGVLISLSALAIQIRGRIFRTRRDLMQRHHAWTSRNETF